jgi:hypothetical protein
MNIHESIHIMLILLAHVFRGAGTFTLKEKIKMINFVGYILHNTDLPLLNTGDSCYYQPHKTNHSSTPRIN